MTDCQSDYDVQPALYKNPSDVRQLEVDFYSKCAALWKANEDTTLNEYALPTRPNGFAYQVTVAGRTGTDEPRWPTSIGVTVVNGSTTYQCAAAGTNGISAISSPSVTSDPSGLTISGVAVSETRKIVLTVSGGVLGSEYDLVYAFTLNGVARESRQKVHVLLK